MVVAGHTFGNIASMTSDRLCYSFATGYALPADEEIQCTNPINGASSCSISGILAKH
jgi:hypothetical protein